MFASHALHVVPRNICLSLSEEGLKAENEVKEYMSETCQSFLDRFPWPRPRVGWLWGPVFGQPVSHLENVSLSWRLWTSCPTNLYSILWNGIMLYACTVWNSTLQYGAIQHGIGEYTAVHRMIALWYSLVCWLPPNLYMSTVYCVLNTEYCVAVYCL